MALLHITVVGPGDQFLLGEVIEVGGDGKRITEDEALELVNQGKAKWIDSMAPNDRLIGLPGRRIRGGAGWAQ